MTILVTPRRKFFSTFGGMIAAAWALPSVLSSVHAEDAKSTATPGAAASEGGPFKVPALPYDYNALEPTIDEKTMHLHHDKHHGAYVSKLNAAVKDHPDLA